jgi:hypothetical protein
VALNQQTAIAAVTRHSQRDSPLWSVAAGVEATTHYVSSVGLAGRKGPD